MGSKSVERKVGLWRGALCPRTHVRVCCVLGVRVWLVLVGVHVCMECVLCECVCGMVWCVCASGVRCVMWRFVPHISSVPHSVRMCVHVEWCDVCVFYCACVCTTCTCLTAPRT